MREYIIFPKPNLSYASSKHSSFCWDCKTEDLISTKLFTIEASDKYFPAAVPLALDHNTLHVHRAAYSWLSSDCLSVKHQWQNIKHFKPRQGLFHIILTWRWSGGRGTHITELQLEYYLHKQKHLKLQKCFFLQMHLWWSMMLVFQPHDSTIFKVTQICHKTYRLPLAWTFSNTEFLLWKF